MPEINLWKLVIFGIGAGIVLFVHYLVMVKLYPNTPRPTSKVIFNLLIVFLVIAFVLMVMPSPLAP